MSGGRRPITRNCGWRRSAKPKPKNFLTLLARDDREVAQQAAPLQALKQLILEKTEGTPFFMEEIVQELVEQGVLSARRWRDSAALAAPAHRPAYSDHRARRLGGAHRPPSARRESLTATVSRHWP